MESPYKKRKLASQESYPASSTPHDTSRQVLVESPSISGINDNRSNINSNIHPRARKLLSFSPTKENQNVAVTKKTAILELLENSSSIAEITLQDDGDEELDYDEFFRNLRSFHPKGNIWNLYKPIGEQDGSLYHQITMNPREAPELARWLVEYCQNKSNEVITYILYRFYFDCSGYQKFNLRKYYQFPPKFDYLVGKLNSDKYTEEIFKTKRFLFADDAKVAKILKYGIYNFIQKFVLEAHEVGTLYDPPFNAFLKLLLFMCKNAGFRPLVFTAFTFVIKILTAICMVKEKVAHISRCENQDILDNYLNLLYVCFSRVTHLTQKELSPLRIACINELKLWIQYSSKIFVEHYNCPDVLKRLLVDEVPSVRLSALESLTRIIKNEELIGYFKSGPIDNIIEPILGRICDVNMEVQLKAIEILIAMIPVYDIRVKNLVERIVEMMYHKDYRLGTCAGKCTMEMLIQDSDDEMALLLGICRIAKRYHPTLKSLLVESLFDHTNVLQNWTLFVRILIDECSVPIDLKIILSELLVESVHLSLVGMASKVRINSKVRSVSSANNGILANAFYPHLKRIVFLYKKDEMVIANFFKILVEIAPEYLTKDHCAVADQVIQFFKNFFMFWNSMDTTNALLNYLLYINQHLPLASTRSKHAIEDIQKSVSEELYKSFKSKDNHTLIMAKKTAIVFSKIDLNEHIEWSKLLSAWTLIESNTEFIEDMLTSCHHSLIWKFKKLYATQALIRYSKSDLTKEITLISKMYSQFFSVCHEVARVNNRVTKFKAFEQLYKTYTTVCIELENVCKQERAFEELKPTIDEALRGDMLAIFESSADPIIDPDNVPRFKKYITYMFDLVCWKLLPMEDFSVILKYFDKYYEYYGKFMETILITIRAKNENWIPLLMVNTLAIIYEQLMKKHGVVDIRSHEAKSILSLAKRFHESRKIMNPKIAAKLLVFAVNYASSRKLYEFLIFVRIFIDDLHNDPKDCKEILKSVKEKMPPSTKNDSVLYFVEHLRKSTVNETLDKSKTATTNKAPPKKPLPIRTKKATTPKIKAQGPKPTVKGKRLFKKASQSTESSAENMSIHDTSSDEPEFPYFNKSEK